MWKAFSDWVIYIFTPRTWKIVQTIKIYNSDILGNRTGDTPIAYEYILQDQYGNLKRKRI